MYVAEIPMTAVVEKEGRPQPEPEVKKVGKLVVEGEKEAMAVEDEKVAESASFKEERNASGSELGGQRFSGVLVLSHRHTPHFQEDLQNSSRILHTYVRRQLCQAATVDPILVRPILPREARRQFNVSEDVDAFHNDGWWEYIVITTLDGGGGGSNDSV
ncbi:Uncharacterized protein Adt_31760 [Abeliophyllum distichum]|uniref:Uncharacterized protein n=1 Tax=Abeliophyllum distichum TaxID=126358 RepID=A0ABD1RG22_9LAMI